MYIINEAYSVGEKGIVANMANPPSNDILFERVNVGSLTYMLKTGKLMVAMTRDGALALGCVKIELNADPCDDSVGEWGMLCVDRSIQRRGLGTLLREAAE